MSDLITPETQKLAPNALVELYVLDTTVIGFDTLDYFFAGTDTNRLPIVFQGQTYQPIPLQVTGFEYNGQGTIPNPTFAVSNVGGIISATALQFDDLVGAKVSRKRTFAKFLDDQPTADPSQEFPIDIFYVNRKVSENAQVVTFELTTSFDVTGLMLPSRQILQNSCPWIYKSPQCSWVPFAGHYFDATDTAQELPGADACGKRLSSCICRFQTNVLPFGGFPGAQSYV